MSTLVECSLDQPFLSDGNTDNRANSRSRNSIVELSSAQHYFRRKTIHLIVVGIIDQTVFSINENPVEASTVNNALGEWGRGVSEHEPAGRVTDEHELT